MRYHIKKCMMGREMCLGFVFLLVFVSAQASELLPAEDKGITVRHKEYDPDLPRHETTGNLVLGFQWLDQDDSQRAGEYDYLDSSVIGSVEINSYPLPQRMSLKAEYLGSNNLYTDLGYAYKDLVLFRDVLSGIYHNLDHYNYLYAGTPPSINYNDRNPLATYHNSYLDNVLSLRLKAPDFPLHTYLKQRHIENDGSVQQRSLIGYYNNITKLSQTRNRDWQSDEWILGTNSHLGPVEVDYAYGYTRFDPGANNILYDAYPVSLARLADTYPHDAVPMIESWANTLKVHTSYTGRIVASASLSNLQRENAYSDSQSNTWRGAADFKWMPYTALGLFMKYRHSALDAENPGTVTLKGLTQAYSYSVRQSISSQKDALSFTANYRPLKKITLVSTYEFEHMARKDSAEWSILPSYTDSNALRLAAYIRPLKNLKFKFALLHKKFNDPAYNIEPDYLDQLQFATTYLPTEKITALVDYSLFSNKRDHLRYLTSTLAVVDGGEREDKNDRILGSLSFLVTPQIILSTSLAYQRNRIEQTLGYGRFVGAAVDLPFLDSGVNYTDEARYYGVGVQYTPWDDITVSADISRTDTKGEFLPGMATALSPVSLASFSSIRVSEIQFSVEVIKKFRADWEVDLQFMSNAYNDKIDNALDGDYYSSVISLRRRF